MPSLLDLLSQTWPARMAKGTLSALALPGDVYAGRVDPLSEGGIQRSFDLASVIAGVPGTPRNAVGTSMGPLYHGSPQKALSELLPSTRGPFGEGVYTSPLPRVAQRYAGEGGKVYELPKTYDVYQGLGYDRYSAQNMSSEAAYQAWKSDQKRLVAAAPPEKRKQVAEVVGKSWHNEGYSMIRQLQQIMGSDEATQTLFKKAGFEGMSGHVDGPEVLLFGTQKTR